MEGLAKLASLIREARERQLDSHTKDRIQQNDVKHDGNAASPAVITGGMQARITTPNTEEPETDNESLYSKDNEDMLTDLSPDEYQNENDIIEEIETFEKNDNKQSSGRGPQPTSFESRNDRTVFVGNVPISLSKKKLLKLFSVYGQVEAARMRSAAVFPGKLPVKVARRLKKQLTGNTVNWYVVMATPEEAQQCLSLNGTEIDERHLRVDMATPTRDNKRTVFVGNLPFSTDAEELREVFGQCGEVDGVRVVRDNKTGVGKGIAYVMFKDSSGVLFAIKQDSKLELSGRKLRVSRCKSKNTDRSGESRGSKAIATKKKSYSKYGGMKANSGGKNKKSIKGDKKSIKKKQKATTSKGHHKSKSSREQNKTRSKKNSRK